MTAWALDRITCFVNFESNLENFTNSQLIYLKDLVNAIETPFPKIIEMKFKGGFKKNLKVILLIEQRQGEDIYYHGNSLLGEAVKMATGSKCACKVSTQTPGRDPFSLCYTLSSRGD